MLSHSSAGSEAAKSSTDLSNDIYQISLSGTLGLVNVSLALSVQFLGFIVAYPSADSNSRVEVTSRDRDCHN